ncbi:RdgB/HAM1 family non-canonical purine NTP pyrophosphatase [Aquihabitans sp. G128]|uniref:RdgB/HAM1 family non-canonical purine NTP pyrophosphatase n=1 Tax=Aquihabitans sp. G128 TaxID=2849779 RepID=UPI001C250DA0|nr:RdgB/HAM1 family non-canonical purine NTP pyrophosphatase [Aquihabitans sp. G128]QXC62764.1 RdgB/HAM1 family non-canonical purine NTP pyrophosphatase [Aquihabitans sp. G128]
MVLASANPKKVAELREILDHEIDLVPRPPEVPEVVEDADTFVGNARLKAAALLAATGIASVADDSGLEVDALDGAPGVWSARYAGEGATDEANVDKLLAALAERPDPADRRARFRCVVVLQRPDGSEVVADGTCEGHIAPAPRGAGGFGYDPVFVPDDADGRTFGELGAEEKHAISHRGHALAAFVAQLRDA